MEKLKRISTPLPLIIILELTGCLLLATLWTCTAVEDLPLGQRILPEGMEQPRQRIRNTLGGFYSQNVTLFFRNSPFRVQTELIVESSATITIETGVQMYFDTGVGMKVFGTIRAIGNEFAHIQMLPYQEQLNYEDSFPDFRLIDGPNVRQGRLQVRFRDRWRSVCNQLTNWTSIDTGVACRSMGYSDGGFWRYYSRNNDTYPLVMAAPECLPTAKIYGNAKALMIQIGFHSLKTCAREKMILDFTAGGLRHLLVGLNTGKVYKSSVLHLIIRLEFIDILYAGYDGLKHSARDGIYFYEPPGPILIANSTIRHNRGHGIAIDNTVDGRFFLNQTKVINNYGDGVWYKQKHAGLSLSQGFLGTSIGTAKSSSVGRSKRQTSYYEKEKPRLDMCNGTLIDPLLPPNICWIMVSLPARLPYSYTIQFIDIDNRNPPELGSRTELIVCEGNGTFPNVCQNERYRIPMNHGVLPQSVSLTNSQNPLYIGLEYGVGQSSMAYVFGDVDLLFKIHASVTYKAFYGLNITNSVILNNTGNGIQAINIRDRTALSNVTVEGNEGLAGFLVRDGAADIWVNDTSLSYNWGDGMNVSYAGGSINLNSSRLSFNYNDTIPFYALRQEIIIKGRPSNNIFYPKMMISDNLWGGVLVGNYCTPLSSGIQPKVLINWVEFNNNHYHPSIEVFSCQRSDVSQLKVDVSGNNIVFGTAMGFRMEPCVNTELIMNSNRFHNIKNTAILVRNAKHPHLAHLKAKVVIAKNDIKMNEAQYIVSIGLNEDAPLQHLTFNQQNEVRSNIVINPFPFLKPRSTPYAALVVSSSNIGTELMEHAKVIDAKENNWGDAHAQNFLQRIFDQFNRFSLASIDVNPYAAVCNQRAPTITYVQQYYRQFRQLSSPLVIGGTIFENNDLQAGR
uniref:SRCR domain-containing protein n=1 Tax=Ditylenchus dipsaci TaxID=166011 RepID=A0A915CLZ3_9BILA